MDEEAVTSSFYDDAANVLYFLLYLRKDKGGDYLYGGRELDEVIDSAARLAHLNKTGLAALEEQI